MVYRRIAAVLFLATVGATPSLAQSAKPASADDKVAAKFIGEWEGAYQTDHGPSGPISMRFAKDSAWKVTEEIISGSQTIPTLIANVSVDGNTIAWTQDLMGMSCKTSAVLDGEQLKGTTQCEHVSMTMVMRKK
ncbi:MAG TPA: hypothetical protein VF785_24045 [Gemmatimonadaceae bacterium]